MMCVMFLMVTFGLEVAMLFVCRVLDAQAPTTGIQMWVDGCMQLMQQVPRSMDLKSLRRAMLVGSEMIGVNDPCSESVLVRGIQRIPGTHQLNRNHNPYLHPR